VVTCRNGTVIDSRDGKPLELEALEIYAALVFMPRKRRQRRKSKEPRLTLEGGGRGSTSLRELGSPRRRQQRTSGLLTQRYNSRLDPPSKIRKYRGAGLSQCPLSNARWDPGLRTAGVF